VTGARVLSVSVRSGPGSDRCEWHAGGTAGEEVMANILVPWLGP
jgi:hypothetical protein